MKDKLKAIRDEITEESKEVYVMTLGTLLQLGLTSLIVYSWLNGTWQTTVTFNFNAIGEGYLELILMPLVTFFMAKTTLKKIIKA